MLLLQMTTFNNARNMIICNADTLSKMLVIPGLVEPHGHAAPGFS